MNNLILQRLMIAYVYEYVSVARNAVWPSATTRPLTTCSDALSADAQGQVSYCGVGYW